MMSELDTKGAIRTGAGCLLLTGLVFSLGCGPGMGELSGKVSYNGKPVMMGTVQVSAENGAHTGIIKEDGTYSVAGIQTGTVKIAVTSLNPAKSNVVPRKKGEAPPKEFLPTGDPAKWFPVPEKFGQFDTSGVTFPLKSGKNTYDIVLK